jgi:hypothetical protein
VERWKGWIENRTSYRRTDGIWAEKLNEAMGDIEQDLMEKKGDESLKEEGEGRTRFCRGIRET